MPIQLPFDLYNFRARQIPVTIALAPAIITALVAEPTLQGLWGFLSGVVAALGLPYAFAQAAGDAGKRLEPGLYAAWSGMPSVALLRHRDTRIDPITKQAYFETLRQVGIPMPTPEDEARDPTGADKAYEAASAWLRKETQDAKAYPRVKTELTNYGLARNLLGLRWLGVAIAVFGALVAAGLVAMSVMKGGDVTPLPVLSLVFSLGMVAFWLWRVRPRWARRAADAYALALLEACERRKAPSPPRKAASRRKASQNDAAAPDIGIGPQRAADAPAQGTAAR